MRSSVPISGNSEHPKNRLGSVEILRISRISRIPRISRKMGIRWDPNIPHRGDFGFSLRGPVLAKYLVFPSKLEAWRNPPIPTLVVWAGSVYPDLFCRMYHIFIDGCLSREIRNAQNLLRDVEILRISRISRKIGSGGLR